MELNGTKRWEKIDRKFQKVKPMLFFLFRKYPEGLLSEFICPTAPSVTGIRRGLPVVWRHFSTSLGMSLFHIVPLVIFGLHWQCSNGGCGQSYLLANGFRSISWSVPWCTLRRVSPGLRSPHKPGCIIGLPLWWCESGSRLLPWSGQYFLLVAGERPFLPRGRWIFLFVMKCLPQSADDTTKG